MKDIFLPKAFLQFINGHNWKIPKLKVYVYAKSM